MLAQIQGRSGWPQRAEKCANIRFVSTLLEPEILPQLSGGDHDRVTHRVCCVNEDKTFCGAPSNNGDIVPEHAPYPECVACDQLERVVDNCPMFGRCIDQSFSPIGN